MPTFDEVLQEAGEFGRYQKRVFLLLCMTGITFAFSFVGIVFLGQMPESYWCRSSEVAELSKNCGWSAEEERNFTVPRLHDDKSGQSLCDTYDITWNATISPLICASPMYSLTNQSLNQLPTKPCQGGWVYEEYRTTIISQYDLVCSDAWKLDLTQSSLNMGFLIGALTLGYAADRYGRKVTYLISSFGVGLCGVVVAFAPNFYVLVFFRFLQGIFGKGTWMTCYVIVQNHVVKRHASWYTLKSGSGPEIPNPSVCSLDEIPEGSQDTTQDSGIPSVSMEEHLCSQVIDDSLCAAPTMLRVQPRCEVVMNKGKKRLRPSTESHDSMASTIPESAEKFFNKSMDQFDAIGSNAASKLIELNKRSRIETERLIYETLYKSRRREIDDKSTITTSAPVMHYSFYQPIYQPQYQDFHVPTCYTYSPAVS